MSYIAAVEESQAEHVYLAWFRNHVDFGPGHGDVIENMHERYEKETGNKVPYSWIEE